jgi:hypothetical protein
MKTLKLFTALWALNFVFTINSNAQNNNSNQVQTIHPSAIVHIPKIDANNMATMQNSTNENEENEFKEQFRRGSHAESKIADTQKNNSGENTFQARINSCPLPPIVQTNFEGNRGIIYCGFSTGPTCWMSESDIAISNAGKIVSVSNNWINYYNENGTLLFSDTLYHFGHGTIDPRVLYDPKSDRFIFSALSGLTDHVSYLDITEMVVGFSKTNNPMNGWNIYKIPFTDFNDNSSGDYPQIAVSDSELIVTISYFASSPSLKHAELIQMDKFAGYSGASFINSQRYEAPFSGSVKGTLMPARGGSTSHGTNMYFLMADETGNNSNKYVLYELTNTLSSGLAVLSSYGIFYTNLPYSGCGTSYQPGGLEVVDQSAPKDDYIANAFYENGIIQFCQIANANGKASPYIGRITGIPNALSCTAKAVSSPNLYLSFPSIAYAGNSSMDNSAIVGMQHSGTTTFPGLTAVYINSNFDISPLVTVKNGNDTLNYYWGDYSGICRRFNHPGECWFEGQYGSLTADKANWIAKLKAPATCSGRIANSNIANSILIIPNPISNSTTISFSLSQSQKVSLKIFDLNGRLVSTLADRIFEEEKNEIVWYAADINAGIYFLQFQTSENLQTEKLIVTK